jgi:hypothetical protein
MREHGVPLIFEFLKLLKLGEWVNLQVLSVFETKDVLLFLLFIILNTII